MGESITWESGKQYWERTRVLNDRRKLTPEQRRRRANWDKVRLRHQAAEGSSKKSRKKPKRRFLKKKAVQKEVSEKRALQYDTMDMPDMSNASTDEIQ
jgi:hypothetical protein